MTRRRIDASLVGLELPPMLHRWTRRDVILYALGVGATAADLDLVYEARGPRVLPTYAVIPSSHFLPGFLEAVDFELGNLLHGEQSIMLHRPIPAEAAVESTRRCVAVWDKGGAAVIVWESVSSDADGPLFTTTSASFVRGAGGFGGDRGPSGARNAPPERAPDVTLAVATHPDQAALYRLSGDLNPMHIDPEMARSFGYERPFLHGLCTYGVVARAVVAAVCDGVPERLEAYEARFAGLVYPGDTLNVRVWRTADDEAVLDAQTERGPALNGARMRFRRAAWSARSR
ncbi:MAG TPA: MaoC/PaaZ C-terminal domain-containing protein [Candidatus Angelobacter sp.]|jgi:acyl dehydratase|nr:MaoC/PaaZ C-terminal domain-containing protein [Candidatus Angelobacter sp.]